MRHVVVGLLCTVLAMAGIAEAQRWVHFVEPCKAYNKTNQVQMPFLEEMVNLIVKPTETPKNVLDMYYRLPNPLRLEQDILVELRYAVCRLMVHEDYDYTIKPVVMEQLPERKSDEGQWVQIIPVTLFFVYLVNKFMTTY